MFLDREKPPHTKDPLALWAETVSATARWTEGLIERLDAGGYRMADDP